MKNWICFLLKPENWIRFLLKLKIGALIIKELFDYSDDEIVENLMLYGNH